MLGKPGTGTFATTVFVASEMTLTESENLFATKTSPFAGSYAMPYGRSPTEIVATTVFVVSEITPTLKELKFVTNTSPLPTS